MGIDIKCMRLFQESWSFWFVLTLQDDLSIPPSCCWIMPSYPSQGPAEIERGMVAGAVWVAVFRRKLLQLESLDLTFFFFECWEGNNFFFLMVLSNMFGNFHPENWGRCPIWRIFFRWIETTNYVFFFGVLLLETSQPFGFDVRHHVSSLSLGSVPWEENASSIFVAPFCNQKLERTKLPQWLQR